MTTSTGKRSFRACLRCRRRKTKCDLNGVGDRKEPPCKSCHLSGSKCVLVQSRRGHKSKKKGLGSRQASIQLSESLIHIFEPSAATGRPSTYAQENELHVEPVDGSSEPAGSDNELDIELRNPSDALEILARSDKHPRGRDDRLPAASCSPTNQASSFAHSVQTIDNRRTTLDGYELLKDGVLQIGVILELLHTYAKSYHPYCPLIPEWFLSSTAVERIVRSDHFLLTVLLTIASRDTPEHMLVHRYCWDYTQRLLLDIFLARLSTQTPRTVEGLLLLAEWLPHIQTSQTTEKAPKNLFGEDRLAWSLVGLAIRQGYMLRLDRGAFRGTSHKDMETQGEQKRLIWHFICLADRHISVRLGQSFWSRGPSLSSHFTADDFPSLKPQPGRGNDDHAAVLQANLELVQVLYNAHLILYASPERTQALIKDGDYARYLDDFLRAATMWEAVWKHLKVSPMIRTSVLLTYEYVCLYVNAFSFQAVLARSSGGPKTPQTTHQGGRLPAKDLFCRGIMSSPDGLYINGAIQAATKLLEHMTSLDSHREFRYLPSRFNLYGVYAAVFLHKAVGAGAIKAKTQLNEVSGLISRLITIMREAPTTEAHVCYMYSEMLQKLWRCRNTRCTSSPDASANSDSPNHHPSHDPCEGNQHAACSSPAQPLSGASDDLASRDHIGHNASTDHWDDLGTFKTAQPTLYGPLPSDNLPTPAFFDEFTMNSFWPGIADLSQPEDLTCSWLL